jgi:predicted metal-dependent TIM-barrel fold hydrolase
MVAEGDLEVGFHGEYREIVPNERIVSTEVFVEHSDKQTRDMVIETGMEAGMQESMDRLEQVAISLSA